MQNLNAPYRGELKHGLQSQRLGSLKVSVKNLLRMLNVNDESANDVNEPSPEPKQYNRQTQPLAPSKLEDKENRGLEHLLLYRKDRKNQSENTSTRKVVPLGTHTSGTDLNVSNNDRSSLLIEQYLKGDKAKEYTEIWKNIYDGIHQGGHASEPAETLTPMKLQQHIREPLKERAYQKQSQPTVVQQTRPLSTEEEDDDDDVAPVLPSKIPAQPIIQRKSETKHTKKTGISTINYSATAYQAMVSSSSKPTPSVTTRKKRRQTLAPKFDYQSPSETLLLLPAKRFEYVPSTTNATFSYPIQAIKNRLDLAKHTAATNLPTTAATSRLSVSTRHDSEKLANRYGKELRLRNDLLHKVNGSYLAAQVW